MPGAASVAFRTRAGLLPVGEALRSLMLARCRQVDRALADARRRHAGIHRARKGIRVLRAMLALRGDTGDGAAAAIDRRLRRLARSLSALRDAHVAAQTAEWLARDEAVWSAAACALRAACERQLADALAADPGFAARRAQLARVRHALDALPWSKVGASACRQALRRSRQRTRRGAAHARHRPTLDTLHAWRRRLRRQRLQVDALVRLAAIARMELPDRHGRHMRELKRLSDALGRRQDLRLLRRHLARLDRDVPRDDLKLPMCRALAVADEALGLHA